MIGNYQILTITHRQTNLADIEKFVIPDAEGTVLCARLEELKVKFEIEELFYLATCNRVMYFFHTHHYISQDFAKEFFQFINPSLDFAKYGSKIAHFHGDEALQHLLQVSASIDSMVVGEREILRQLREAYERCFDWKLAGDNLRLAFRLAIESGKEVYAQTKIGEKPVSVVSLAIQKMRQYHLPKNARILMVGAGQTNRLVAKFLKKMEVGEITIFNRTLKKAEEVAQIMNGEAKSLSELSDFKGGFDCMIVCTGSTKSVITPALYQQLLQGEINEKLIIDLSIPYNVSKEVVDNFSIKYVEIEGLKALANTNHEFRKKEVKKAKLLIDRQLEEFHNTYRQRQIARAMSSVPAEIKQVKYKAVNEVFQKDLEALDEETRTLVMNMMDYMERRCIGIPMKAAKELVL